jgi:hypothetical protein
MKAERFASTFALIEVDARAAVFSLVTSRSQTIPATSD